MRKTTELPKARFWNKVQKTETCWTWLGAKQGPGYGLFRINGKLEKAHRAAWTLVNGPIPEGICVLHNCPDGDNPSCVNPGHLFLGTKAENNRDRDNKGRGVRLKGEAHGRSKLTEEQVRDIKTRRLSARGFAKLYGISKSASDQIFAGRNWKWL